VGKIAKEATFTDGALSSGKTQLNIKKQYVSMLVINIANLVQNNAEVVVPAVSALNSPKSHKNAKKVKDPKVILTQLLRLRLNINRVMASKLTNTGM
jgi:hypothetical protein